LSDTTIYEPYIRALLGTASHFCEAVVVKLRTVPLGTALRLRIIRVIRRGAHAMYERAALLNARHGPQLHWLAPGLGFRIWGIGFRGWGLGFRVEGLWFGV